MPPLPPRAKTVPVIAAWVIIASGTVVSLFITDTAWAMLAWVPYLTYLAITGRRHARRHKKFMRDLACYSDRADAYYATWSARYRNIDWN